MATFDIALPSGTRAVFPPRCVCCGKENPTGTTTLSVTGSGSGPSLAEVAVDAAIGSSSRAASNIRVTIQAPACPSCAKNLERRHFWKTVLLYAGALGGVVLLVVGLTTWHSFWLGGLGLTTGILGPVIWELKDPPAFTFTPAGAKITYEFRSESYASEFAGLNAVQHPSVVVSPPPLP